MSILINAWSLYTFIYFNVLYHFGYRQRNRITIYDNIRIFLKKACNAKNVWTKRIFTSIISEVVL